MANSLEISFSNSFTGTVWNTLTDGNHQRLYVEVRDIGQKRVTFSAVNVQDATWLWRDVVFEETWWISLTAVSGDILLLTLYTDSSNPDKKSLIAYDVVKGKISWWKNGFSFSAANSSLVQGMDAKFGPKSVVLDLFSGEPVDHVDFHLEHLQNFPVIRPFQYEQDTAHFNTVRDFLELKCGIQPVVTIEYLELESLIIASVFVKEQDLANYLYVFTAEGKVLLKELLGRDLKGVGLDTFFIFSGHLIFVKNKCELLSYKIV